MFDYQSLFRLPIPVALVEVFSAVPPTTGREATMARTLRWIQPRSLVAISTRIMQSRHLLRPSRDTNDIFMGAVGRAAEQTGLDLHAMVALSTHYHLLVTVETSQQLAEFMCRLNSKVAREIGKLVDWKEKFWGDRYHAILVSEEEEAQVTQLRYVLEQGCKEDLVMSPLDWPGVHCAQALVDGEPLVGWWFDRTKEYAARRRGESYGKYDHATQYAVELSPIPAWKHLTQDEYRRRVSDLVSEIEEETLARHRAQGTKPLGARKVMRVSARRRAKKPKKSPIPLVHAATKAVRMAYKEGYRWFEAAFREAAILLKAGEVGVSFPEWCFPPGLPYVAGS